MTRFASFIANQQDGQTPVSINPARVVAVIAVLTPNGRASEFSAIEVGDRVIEVVGSVAEVVAALESATAPPVAAAVEASDEMKSAAMVLDLLADAAAQRDLGFVDGGAVDDVIGASGADWDSTEATLRALAAKLRGGG
mgnify:CR=1 FL=1